MAQRWLIKNEAEQIDKPRGDKEEDRFNWGQRRAHEEDSRSEGRNR